MKTETLVYFLSIASTGSITKTAEQHFISQQAVSEHIKKLEKEFNITLLQKTQTGVKLTEQGQRFLTYAKSFLSIYQEAQTELNVSYQHRQPAGTLRLNAHSHLSYTDFWKFVARFQSKYTNIKLSFNEMYNGAIISALHQEKIDVGLFFCVQGVSDITDSSLSLHTLYESNFYYCFSKTHPLANLGRPITQSDITSYTVSASPTPDIDKESFYQDFFQSANLNFLLNLVNEGTLIGIFPEEQAKHFLLLA